MPDIKDEIPLADGVVRTGMPATGTTYVPRDDFGAVPESVEAGEKAIEAERKRRPAYESPCPRCRRVHEVQGDPICICANDECQKMSRIVWCGQCIECAYARFSREFGEGVPAKIWPQYAAWREEQAKKVAQEGLPWEK